MLFLTLFGALTSINVSSIFDGVGKQGYLVCIICIFIAYKYNFKRKIYNEQKIQ